MDEWQPPIDSVAGEAVNAQSILSTQHLPAANSFQDAQLIRRETLRVNYSLLFDLRFSLGSRESGRGFGIVGERGSFLFFSGLLHVFQGHGVRMR